MGKPSELAMSELRTALRQKALLCHPDKTGLMAKKKLTVAEQEELQAATTKFHELQTHFDTLASFINERDKPGSIWTEILSEVDHYCNGIMKKFRKVDETAKEKKIEVLMGK